MEMVKSPVPSKVVSGPKTLSFLDAIREIMNGRKVSRLEWKTNDVYCGLVDNFLMVFRGDTDKMWHAWSVNDGDLFSTDWFVMPDQTEVVQ